jgi:hypothetical protein
MLLFGFAMVVIMIWRPRGLIATREPSIFLRPDRHQVLLPGEGGRQMEVAALRREPGE